MIQYLPIARRRLADLTPLDDGVLGKVHQRELEVTIGSKSCRTYLSDWRHGHAIYLGNRHPGRCPQ